MTREQGYFQKNINEKDQLQVKMNVNDYNKKTMEMNLCEKM